MPPCSDQIRETSFDGEGERKGMDILLYARGNLKRGLVQQIGILPVGSPVFQDKGSLCISWG
jgi:hypothetical protein